MCVFNRVFKNPQKLYLKSNPNPFAKKDFKSNPNPSVSKGFQIKSKSKQNPFEKFCLLTLIAYSQGDHIKGPIKTLPLENNSLQSLRKKFSELFSPKKAFFIANNVKNIDFEILDLI